MSVDTKCLGFENPSFNGIAGIDDGLEDIFAPESDQHQRKECLSYRDTNGTLNLRVP